MLPAIPTPPVQRWFDWYCRRSLRKFFHRVQLFGDVPFTKERSTIYVVNHSCFWDVIVMNFLISNFRRQQAYCMADAVQVSKHPVFRRVGAFSVDRKNPRDGLRAIQYAADKLNGPACAVVLFPQGKIESAHLPLHYERGIERLAQRAPAAQVIVVALRYEYWLNQRPEVLVDLSPAKDSLKNVLEEQTTQRLALLAEAGKHYTVGSRILLTGRRSINETRFSRMG